MVLMESEYEKGLVRGDVAPDFSLKGTDGKVHSLQELKGEKATLVVFMCNHCPYVIPKVKELIRIAADFAEQGLTVIGINSNESANYPEDSYENMKKEVEKRGINFAYLHDETQETAKAYGAVCTPDPFLFDKELKLIFHSRIDDTHADQPAKNHELHDAIKEFLKEGKITIKETPSMGCSIKWNY